MNGSRGYAAPCVCSRESCSGIGPAHRQQPSLPVGRLLLYARKLSGVLVYVQAGQYLNIGK